MAPSYDDESSIAAIWSRLLESTVPKLSAAAARGILQIKFSEEEHDRMHELAMRAQAGQLSEAEFEEAENYGRIGALIDIMQSLAQAALKKRASRKPARVG
jgi:leucyl aminopeptidase (aminopeptidase T)